VIDTNVMRLLSGLADPLLAPVAGLPAGAHVVQLACGTGGLALALARRRPDLRITATDIQPAVLDAGRARAEADGLSVTFRVMDMAALELGDGSADAIISRMGLLLPGTAPFGSAAREALRVLRPGGLLSIATWTDLAASPYTRFGLGVLRRMLPPGAVPDMEAAFDHPVPLETYLTDAGFREVAGTAFGWDTWYPDFAAWWAFVAEFGPLRGRFPDGAGEVMAAAIAEFRTPEGGYLLPATARLLTARR
jgi:SAM-dependent methyltransferase